MIMKIVEYKRHLVSGVVQDPEFIISGGVFINPANTTWVGKILDEADRPYYVPDSIVELTRQELIDRQLALQATYPITRKSDPNDPNSPSVPLTDAEVVSVIDAWIQE